MDVPALKASWARIEQLGDQAPALFYAILFTLAPEMRSMFPIAMNTQRDKFLSAMGHLVKNVNHEEQFRTFVSQLGRDHRRFEVFPHHYPVVGRALLATLERALGSAWTAQLADDWAAAYNMVAGLMVDAAQEAAALTPPWWDAKVLDAQQRCAEITVLTVQPDLPYSYVPGQSLAVETALRPKVWRYLSPANRPRSDGTLEFHIRAVRGGQVSPALAYRLRAGDTLRLGAPVGTALIGYLTSPRNLLLIAGGTGLAPLRAIIEQLAYEGTPRLVTLVIGASTATDFYDLNVLTRLDATLPWLNVVYAVSDDPFWTGQRGSAVDVALGLDDWSSCDIFLCGSSNMVAGTAARLVAAGYHADQIHAEKFHDDVYLPAAPARRDRREERVNH
ncbi:globin domain-containing protein [Micromonospora sp. CPCC 206060]|uniref:globin domain-containing protein n=1 Tax=Micromonospora sp. CPCC 206060 TaxID=3122406 RepID=UPI002FF0CD44